MPASRGAIAGIVWDAMGNDVRGSFMASARDAYEKLSGNIGD